jgi:hypothetical protein
MSYIGNTPTQQSFTPAVDFFSGNGSTTAFTLSRPVASVAQVQAVIENVPQKPGDAFTVSGNTITFTSAPPSGTSNIYVCYTSPITQVIAPSQGTVGVSQLSATGTPSSSTYLRGDNTWGTVTSLPGAQGQVFSSSGTFTIPSGITAVKVTVCGAQGGQGGRNTFGSDQGGAGGAGGVAVKYLSGLTSGNTLTVTIGSGGTVGSNVSQTYGTGGSGGTGGSSSVASGTQTITTVSATGGSGGSGGFYGGDPCLSPQGNINGSVGSSGTGSGGDINANQNGYVSSITGGNATGAGIVGRVIFEW